MNRLAFWILLICMPVAAVAGTTSLPFIHDDFASAHSQAMKRKLPIFVECWAPW